MTNFTAIRGLALLAFSLCLSNVNAAPEITVGEQVYVFAASEGDEYSFQPKDSEVDEAMTIVYQPEVKSSEALLDFTNGFRDEYKAAGKVIKQQKAHNDDNEFLGYLVVSIFEDKAANTNTAKMTRTGQTPDGGFAITYQRSFEGDTSMADMIAWFKAQGRAQEKILLTFDVPNQENLPTPTEPKK